jgi:hypothetical protein
VRADPEVIKAYLGEDDISDVIVTPAQAGVQGQPQGPFSLDSRFRGNDE